MVGLLLVGIAAFTQLPVSALPQVDYPTIVVSTNLPGGSADTMASAVTTPLERQFGQMPSLTQMTSVSSFGYSQITLQFDLDSSIDAAQKDVQAAINAASSLLPAQLPTPPTYSKSNPADQPILTLSVSSDTLPLDRGRRLRRPPFWPRKISQVSGVGLVTINGGQKPAVRLAQESTHLPWRGPAMTLEDVRRRRWWARTSISPRATSMGRAWNTPSRPTSCSSRRRVSGHSSSPRAQRIAGAPERRGRRGRPRWRTRSSQAGLTRSAPSFSTCSASPGRTSSRSPTGSKPSCRSSGRRSRRAST